MTRAREENWDKASEHAWRYFEIHAQQRMTVFNFFTVFAALILTGIGASLQAGEKFSVIGAILGGLLSISSFVFWKLDSRTSRMVKRAEAILMAAESALLPVEAKIFTSDHHEGMVATSESAFMREWTFGQSFRFTFAVMALIGLLSAVVCGAAAK